MWNCSGLGKIAADMKTPQQECNFSNPSLNWNLNYNFYYGSFAVDTIGIWKLQNGTNVYPRVRVVFPAPPVHLNLQKVSECQAQLGWITDKIVPCFYDTNHMEDEVLSDIANNKTLIVYTQPVMAYLAWGVLLPPLIVVGMSLCFLFGFVVYKCYQWYPNGRNQVLPL